MMARFVQRGCLKIIDADGNLHVHKGEPGPNVTVRISDRKLYTSLFLNPELKAGEAYVDETLTIEDGTLRDLLMLFAINRKNLRSHPVQKNLRRYLKRIRKFYQLNTQSRSARNVAHHYDLSNELYRLFLDSDMNYSCGYFRSPDDTIETAQQNKLRHIAAKLRLEPGQRVLDVGCGWGSMSMYMAQNFDVDVLGVTLSKEQLDLARARATERGLENKVTFELRDYRDLDGTFDRIVSIGMFEHVGLDHHETFFRKMSALLDRDGIALLHSIGRKGGPGATGSWMRKYIFPGGYAPALSETLATVEKSGLWVTDIEIWRRHYAETLLAWENRFQENRATIEGLLDARFCRMWEFYLILCEFVFRHSNHMVFQIQLTKHLNATPITRDYFSEAENRLETAEA
jgi:cyclopropane-fatty-acyl-phospholipid synthase